MLPFSGVLVVGYWSGCVNAPNGYWLAIKRVVWSAHGLGLQLDARRVSWHVAWMRDIELVIKLVLHVLLNGFFWVSQD